jgi:hypothetical protein
MIISPVDLKPVVVTLEQFPEVTITLRRATMADEGRRYQELFADSDVANLIDIALVETWLTLEDATLTNPDEKPLFTKGMSREQFTAAMTAVWQHSADLFWAIHKAVREANAQWLPAKEGEQGNA